MSTEKKTNTSHPYLAVIAVLAAIMMGVLDGTVMNVALPTLSEEFHVTPSNIIWVVNAYQLIVTMMLLGFAAIGDVFGYKRVFLCGVSIFVTASALCALSTSFEMMVVARVLQGIGGACTMSINTALLRIIFPPGRLGRVMAANAVIVAVTAASGPALGGAILAVGHWSWIFLMNIPLGLAALFIGWKLGDFKFFTTFFTAPAGWKTWRKPHTSRTGSDFAGWWCSGRLRGFSSWDR